MQRASLQRDFAGTVTLRDRNSARASVSSDVFPQTAPYVNLQEFEHHPWYVSGHFAFACFLGMFLL